MDLSGKTILLTGGTGSFGYAFVDRVTRDGPDAVVRIYSRDELKQSEMARALRRRDSSASSSATSATAPGSTAPRRASTSSSTRRR